MVGFSEPRRPLVGAAGGLLIGDIHIRRVAPILLKWSNAMAYAASLELVGSAIRADDGWIGIWGSAVHRAVSVYRFGEAPSRY